MNPEVSESSSAAMLAAAFASTACADAACSLDVEGPVSLLDGLVHIGVLDGATAKRLRRKGSDDGGAASRAILGFRDVVRGVLEALHSGAPVPDRLLDAINRELSKCGCRRQVVREADRYRTRVRFEIETLADVLMPLANAIAETLVSVDPARVKRCREPRCSCYFIDTSKNRTRAWCSMERCGNRAKVSAYYTRSRKML